MILDKRRFGSKKGGQFSMVACAIYSIPMLFILLIANIACPTSLLAAEKLVIGYQSLTLNQSVLWVAKERDIFAKYDQKVELVFLRSGTMATQSLLAGEVHISNLGGPPFVNAVSKGAPLVMVAAVANRPQFQFYGAPGITTERLRGGKVGIGGFGGGAELASKLALRRLGLNPERDVTFLQLGTTPLRLSALRSGQIQGSALLPPDTSLAKNEKLPLLVDLADTDIEFLSSGLVTSKSFVEAHRQTVTNFLKAYIEGLAFLRKQKKESVRIIVKYLRSADVEAISDAYDFVVTKTMPSKPYPTWQSLKIVLEMLGIKRYPHPNAFIDEELVKGLDISGFIDLL